jgi:hypothetical protein
VDGRDKPGHDECSEVAHLANAIQSSQPVSARGELFGHPRGLTFLFTTEMWERFSYYGMRSLLVLYMTKFLLLSDHSGHVIGLAALKRALEGVFGPLDVQPLSSQIWGLYTGLVYFTPIFGGLLADRVLGQRRTVVIGAVLMAFGHFMMAVEQLFLFALLALILGSGCFKPISRRRWAAFTRPAIRAATVPIRSSMSASISARSWRRSSAARWAKASAGITALPPPGSAW